MSARWFLPRFVLSGIVLSVCPTFAHPNHGEESDGKPSAYLDFWVHNTGWVYFYGSLNVEQADPEKLVEPLRAALGCKLEELETDEDEDGHPTLSAYCEKGFDREGMVVDGRINLVPLKKALAEQNVERLNVSVGHMAAAHVDASDALGGFDVEWSFGRYYYETDLAEAANSLTVSFGFLRETLQELAILTVLLIALPGASVFWLGRRAVRSFETRGADVWLSFAGAANGLILLVWAFWWGIVWHYSADLIPAFAFGVDVYGVPLYDFLRNSIWAVVPAVAAIGATAASHPANRRIGKQDWTFAETVLQMVSMLSAILIPALLIFTGLNSFAGASYRSAILLLFAGFALLIPLLIWAQKSQGMTPLPLTTGELRDRIFELAEKAGVRLKQLYLLPAGKGHMANAFAVGNRQVMITEVLLEKLTKREVDAVLGHELAHLKGRHPWRLLPVTGMLLGTLGFVVLTFVKWIPGWAYGGLMIVSLLVVMGLVSRRFERSADAGAVEITDDPEAFIAGQAKVASLNLLPLDWNKGLGFLLTHPSAKQRIEATAKRAGISPERVEQILSEPPPEMPERYAESFPAGEDQKAFSSNVRMMASLGKMISGVTAAIALPLLAAYVADGLRLDIVAEIAVYALALIGTIALSVFFDKWEPLMGLGRVGDTLRVKLQREGISVKDVDGLLIGFGPDPEPRVYEQVHYWDAGFLCLTDDRLSYVGEDTRFSLRRDQITEIEWRDHLPRWWPDPIAIVHWRDDENSREGSFYLGRLAAVPLRQLFAKSSELERRITAWQAGGSSVATRESLSTLESPNIPPVTSQSVAETLSWTAALGGVALIAFVALAAGALVDFPFAWTFGPQGTGWKIVLLAASARAVLAFTEKPVEPAA